MKHLLQNLDCPESIEQLMFILSELYLTFSSNISLDPIKLYTFLYSIDTGLFELCELLVQQRQAAGAQRIVEEHATNLNECLKSILTESSLRVFEIERLTTSFERLKLVCFAFMCQMSVECLQLARLPTNQVVLGEQADSEIHSKFTQFGKHLKSIVFHFIFTTYLMQDEQRCQGLRIKEEILGQTGSHSFHAMSLLIFLDGFAQGTCSVLSFNEFKFCLSLADSLLRHDFFGILSDPLLNMSLMKSLNEYSEYILMLSAFFTWYNR